MSNTIKVCKFCRAEIRVPFETQRGIECPVCGNINNFGGPPLNRQYAGNYENGPQLGGYQYHHPSLPPPRRPAPPRGPHGYYQQPWPPRASNDNYVEQYSPPSSQGSYLPVRPNRYSYQPPPSSPPLASPRHMHSPIYYQPQSPRRPSHPAFTNDYYQPQSPPPQRSSRPLMNVNGIYRPSLQTSAPQGSRRPLHNGYYQQPSPLSSQQPMDDEDYYYQNQTIPQELQRPVNDNNNGFSEQEAPPYDDYYQEQQQTSSPRVHTDGYYQQPLRTPRPQSISHITRPQVPSNGSYNRQPSHLESRPQQHQPESQAQSPRNNRNNSQRFSQYQNESPAPPPPEASANGYNEKQSGRTLTSSYIQQTPHAQPAYGRKRAVVCGVSYLGQKSSLEASISDARSVKDFLVKNMRFPDASILLLTEDEVDPGYQRGVSFIFLPLKLQ